MISKIKSIIGIISPYLSILHHLIVIHCTQQNDQRSRHTFSKNVKCRNSFIRDYVYLLFFSFLRESNYFCYGLLETGLIAMGALDFLMNEINISKKRRQRNKKRESERFKTMEKTILEKIWSIKRIGRADIITSYQMIWNGFEQLL